MLEIANEEVSENEDEVYSEDDEDDGQQNEENGNSGDVLNHDERGRDRDVEYSEENRLDVENDELKQADIQNAEGHDDLTLAVEQPDDLEDCLEQVNVPIDDVLHTVERPIIAPYFPNMMFNSSQPIALQQHSANYLTNDIDSSEQKMRRCLKRHSIHSNLVCGRYDCKGRGGRSLCETHEDEFVEFVSARQLKRQANQ